MMAREVEGEGARRRAERSAAEMRGRVATVTESADIVFAWAGGLEGDLSEDIRL